MMEIIKLISLRRG